MTKISFAFFASILFFASCENDGSSTVGTYEKEETSASSERKDNAAKEENNKKENVRDISVDTSKNITGIRIDSVSSPDKKDTAALAKKNVKVQKTKKVDAKP